MVTVAVHRVPAGRTMEQSETQSTSLVQRAKDFVKDVRVEATKVSWPTRIELRDSTVVVIITVLLVAAFLFAIDRILQSTLGLLFR
jgi:preprotein translocase subunit SecE